ncbi:TPA: AAA family ATPase [Klebsiella pneumoniae]
MINFPIIKKLDVEGYALYPGKDSRRGLHIDFSQQGLTLVLGANGLGKSTLINILFRMLSGPFDLAKFDNTEELGNLNISAVERKDIKSFFSERAHDKATDAIATLLVSFGNTTLTISRNLENLSINEFKIDQTAMPLSNRVADEELFQKEIISLAKVGSFGDWLLILHYIVFYQDNRRALVWDTSAQRELLRILLLNNHESIEWQGLTRQVLELDSEFRNLRYTANKQIKKLKEDRSPEDKTGLRSEAGALKSVRAEKIDYLNKIEKSLSGINEVRTTSRSLRLRTKQEIDSLEREIENIKDNILNLALPDASDALRFILSTLKAQRSNFKQYKISEKYIMHLEKKLNDYFNFISNEESSPEDIASLNNNIKQKEDELLRLKNTLDHQLDHDQKIEQELAELHSHIAYCREEISEINFKLLPIEIGLSKKGDVTSSIDMKIATLEDMIKEKNDELLNASKQFEEYLERVENNFLSNTDKIKTEFSQIVQEFLVEECEITWYSVPWKLGQTSNPINFPAFIFKMKSGGNNMTTERKSPSQVSESQREFIDLAFRIALISTTGSNSSGTIIMDTPEASLDSIFVRNASNIFIKFANQNNNKLLLASNLIDGELLPRLVSELRAKNKLNTGLINLLDIAVPSKAVNDYAVEYRNKFNNIIESSKQYLM